MKVMVFDVGGTAIKYSVMDEDLKVYVRGSRPTPLENQAVFLQTLRDICDTCGHSFAGIAMSLPGFVDSDRGICRTGGRLTYNIGQPVAKQLSDLCGCPVHIENDGKCAAKAELWKGALKGCRNAAVFLIGTGVAGGLIINGEVYKGMHYTAGEFSFLNVNINDWESMDGTLARGCSTTGLIRRYKEAKKLPEEAEIDGKQVFEAVNSGDSDAVDVLKKFCRNVAIQIYNLEMLLDLERVAIGGGISRQDALLAEITKSMDEIYEKNPLNKFNSDIPRTEVVRCAYGNEANQIGALYGYMVSEKMISRRSR